MIYPLKTRTDVTARVKKGLLSFTKKEHRPINSLYTWKVVNKIVFNDMFKNVFSAAYRVDCLFLLTGIYFDDKTARTWKNRLRLGLLK